MGAKVDGRVIDLFSALHEKYGFHAGGEGGEYESLVVDCPVFRKRIELFETEKTMGGGNSGRLEIMKAALVDK